MAYRKAHAIVFGGFGFRPQHLAKHVNLYSRYDIKVHPFQFSVLQMSHPRRGDDNGRKISQVVNSNLDVDQMFLAHVVSGSFWMFLYGLRAMRPHVRSRLRGIVFDSSPPTSQTDAFAGWASHALKRQFLKPYLMPVFVPYRAAMGITPDWEAQVEKWMFGGPEEELIPRTTHVTFIKCKSDPVVCPDNHDRFLRHIADTRSGDARVDSVELLHARHALGIVDAEESYIAAVDDLVMRSLQEPMQATQKEC